jgi:hypothetical protein
MQPRSFSGEDRMPLILLLLGLLLPTRFVAAQEFTG